MINVIFYNRKHASMKGRLRRDEKMEEYAGGRGSLFGWFDRSSLVTEPLVSAVQTDED